MSEATSGRGSAAAQRALWGARAADWAQLQEVQHVPLYEAVLDRVAATPGMRVLDVGCGSGVYCRLAVERGLAVSGLDATPELVALAARRVPGLDVREGEIETLPYPDDTFDLVTGFNAFQYAARPLNALAEARRVTRPRGRVVVATWGSPVACEASGYLAALAGLLPPPPPGAPGPFALSAPGALEQMVTQAGLEPLDALEADTPFVYPNEATALLALLSAGPGVRAIASAGEPRAREAVAEAIAPYRRPDGSYRLRNRFRYLIARA
jgi:SAM-dependent methyltransferase